ACASEIADVVEVSLSGSPGSWTKGDETPLTEVSGLDAASRPGWVIPPSELAAPSLAPRPSARPATPPSTAPRRTRPAPRPVAPRFDCAVPPAADATGSVAAETSYLARLAARSAATG